MEFDEWREKYIEIRKPTLDELKRTQPLTRFLAGRLKRPELKTLKSICHYINDGNDEELKRTYDRWDGDIRYVEDMFYDKANKAGLYEELPQRKTITIISSHRDFTAEEFLMGDRECLHSEISSWSKENIKNYIERLKRKFDQNEISLIFSNDEITDDSIPDCHKRSLVKYERAKFRCMSQWLKDIVQSGNVDDLYSHESLRKCSVCRTLNEFKTRKVGDNVVLPARDMEDLIVLESSNYPTVLFDLMGMIKLITSIIENYAKIVWSCPISKWNKFKTFMNPSSTHKGGCYLLIKEQDFGITPPRVSIGMSENNVIKDYQNTYVLSYHMLSKPAECEKELLEEFRKSFTSDADTFEAPLLEDAVKLFNEICFKYI